MRVVVVVGLVLLACVSAAQVKRGKRAVTEGLVPPQDVVTGADIPVGGKPEQQDLWGEVRELRAVVKEIGELAVRQKIALAATQTDLAKLREVVKASESQAESQKAMIVEQAVQLGLTVSDVKALDGRVGLNEAELREHQPRLIEHAAQLKLLWIKLKSAEFEADELKSTNSGNCIRDEQKAWSILYIVIG